MGKKRKNWPTVEDVVNRPWCYYCERDFDDLKILISHQKAKHFKCDKCHRRLNTAGGLSVHMNQVHKEQLTQVENALPNRQGLEVEIFGVEGIPDEILQSHKQRVLQQYYEAEATRRAKSGNVAPGEPTKRKKIVIESPEELLKRFSEWKVHKSDPTWNAAPIVYPPTGLASNPVIPVQFNQGTAVDDLISSITQEKAKPEEKKSKKEKEKDKMSRLVYSDNDVSPEEKLASLSKYAYRV